MSNLNVLAIDLGSSAARGILGSWNGVSLERHEILRVSHQASGVPLVWNLTKISNFARSAVSAAAKKLGRLPDGVGVCGWGVDFLGVDFNNVPTTPARAYRGPQGVKGRAILDLADWEEFCESGVYPQDINSFYQVAGLLAEQKDYFAGTQAIEFIADWVARDLASAAYGPFNECLEVPAWVSAGVASTSGFFDLNRTDLVPSWNRIGLAPEIIPPVAPELSVVAKRDEMSVIRAGSHDTACAAYSLGADFSGIFISCGSWAIVGAITEKPVVNRSAFVAGITNEATTDGRNRVQVNLTGMWIVQECRRYWEQEGWKPSYAELDQLTFAANLPDGILDVSNPELIEPGNMPAKVTRLAKELLGIELHHPGEILALVHRSVAAACFRAVRDLQELTGVSKAVALIGGGVKDPYFVQVLRQYFPKLIVADAESSALGNLTAQLVTLGVSEADIAAWRSTKFICNTN